MSARNRQVVYNETLPLVMSAAALDLERLRRGFAELFDRAAQAVQLAGYDQDDAVFERYLIVRTADGAEVTIKADWLADRERLIGHLAESLDRGRRHKDTKEEGTKARRHGGTERERITSYELRITKAETQKRASDVDLSGVSIIGIRVEAVVE